LSSPAYILRPLLWPKDRWNHFWKTKYTTKKKIKKGMNEMSLNATIRFRGSGQVQTWTAINKRTTNLTPQRSPTTALCGIGQKMSQASTH
jgi:hypothetical protein